MIPRGETYKTDRNAEIYELVKSGDYTLEKIGKIYGITRERARQIALKEERYRIAERFKRRSQTYFYVTYSLEAQRNKINARSRFRKYKDNQAYDRDLIQKINNLIEAYSDYEEDL